MFSISGLRLYFPAQELWVARSVAGSTSCCLTASCSFAHPAPQSATSLRAPAAALPHVLSTQLPVSAPPTGLDEYFFFISLVVGFPYSSIFCQFWLFFVFKLLLSFFWLCEEAQCVYLCLHLGQKSEVLIEHPYNRVLNSASSRVLVSISFSSFSAILSCSFIWDMFLCLLILADFLCFHVLGRLAMSPSLDNVS